LTSAVTEKTACTPEQLLTMPDGDRFELVDGQLVERKMSKWSSYVAGNIYQQLKNYVDDHNIGWVYPEGTSYQCFPGAPTKVRRPDVSLVALDRMSLDDALAEGHIRIAPDLAVEVLSPNDLAYEIDHKVGEYELAGVKLIWVVNPESKTVRVHRADGTVTVLREAEELEGEGVVPSFRCRVANLFLPAAGAVPAIPPGHTADPTRKV
jgi:Uma2 family endonuclease